MRPLRICQLITSLGLGGAERAVYELARRLDPERFDVQVVALRGGEVADWLAAAGIRVTVLGMRAKWDVWKLPRLCKLLRQERIDLLHTHLFHADLAGRPAAGMIGLPHLIHTVHTAEGRFRPWQYSFARLFSRQCDGIVCVSQSVRDHHAARSGLPDESYTVIPWGIDAEAFARDADSRRRLRRRWKLPNGEILAAFVGRLESYKGVQTLLAAMSHLGGRGEPIDLVIAGEGSLRPIVENFIAHGEGGRRARLLGHVDDVRGVLSAADIFVIPSRWEGWPLALGEAMSASLPAIGTDVAGIRDLITPDRTGLLIEPEDSIALAEALQELAGDAELRRNLGDAARQRVIERFSPEATVAAHEQLYERVAGYRRES